MDILLIVLPFIAWIGCGIIALLIGYFFISPKQGVITIGDVVMGTFLFVFGPMGVVVALIISIFEWFMDNADKPLFPRR